MNKNLMHEENELDLKKITALLIRYLHIFLISILISFLVATIIIKFTPPKYEAHTFIKIKPEESEHSPQSYIESQLFQNNSSAIDDQLHVLGSYYQIRKAVGKLDLHYALFLKEKYYKREIYRNKPIEIKLDSNSYYPINAILDMNFIDDSSFIFSLKQDNVRVFCPDKNTILQFNSISLLDTFYINQEIITDFFRFTVTKSCNYTEILNHKGVPFYLQFYSFEYLIKQFSNIKIERLEASSVVKLSYMGTNRNKICDFLNCLTNTYIEKEVEYKNNITQNIISFINTQLEYAFDSLSLIEKELVEFKQSEKMVNVDLHTQHSFELINELQDRKANLLIEDKYFTYIKNHINDDNDDKLITPSSMDISNPIINSLIIDLIQLYKDRAELKQNTVKNNPLIHSIESKIIDQKNNVLSTIDDIQNKNTLEINEISKRINQTAIILNSLPETQRKLIDIERVYNLNDAIYTLLLTKKSEMQITHASNIPRSEVLKPALTNYSNKKSPNRRNIYVLAFLISLLVPFALIYLITIIRNKIMDKNDIEEISNFPIFGHILRNKCKSNTICIDFPKTTISESFRSLRTNLQFSTKDSKVFLISSSMKGEGKSFIAANLALSFSQLNKKVILLGFDLRNPSLHKLFELDRNKGLSLYLSGNTELKTSIQVNVCKNLDILNAGPIPPNPLELIASEKSKEMLKYLRSIYDVIIIDSPPIGIVSDALHLMQYTDINMIIARQNYTSKLHLQKSIETIDKFSSLNNYIVLNDIKEVKGLYRYAYEYNYKYSQNYYG